MKKSRLIFLIVWSVLALLALAFLAVSRVLAGVLTDQRAAERWKGDNEQDFTQLSCFMSGSDSLTLTDVYTFRGKLLEQLTQASIDAPEGGSLFSDAWSAFGTVNTSGEHGSSQADVVAVGGDFFLFHPMRLVSGSYLQEDDVMDDRVLLDRELAWRLYGGDDLAGMTVTLGEEAKPFLVAGVVDHSDDFFSKKARITGLTVYMSYSAWNELCGENSANVECYELVMPQPVKEFAEGIMKNSFPLGKGELVNNSQRFTLESCSQIIRQFGMRSMHLNNVIYPEWENAARCLGDWCGLFLALSIAFGIFPVASGFVLFLVGLVKLKNLLARVLPGMGSEILERQRQRRWDKNRKDK